MIIHTFRFSSRCTRFSCPLLKEGRRAQEDLCTCFGGWFYFLCLSHVPSFPSLNQTCSNAQSPFVVADLNVTAQLPPEDPCRCQLLFQNNVLLMLGCPKSCIPTSSLMESTKAAMGDKGAKPDSGTDMKPEPWLTPQQGHREQSN